MSSHELLQSQAATLTYITAPVSNDCLLVSKCSSIDKKYNTRSIREKVLTIHDQVLNSFLIFEKILCFNKLKFIVSDIRLLWKHNPLKKPYFFFFF